MMLSDYSDDDEDDDAVDEETSTRVGHWDEEETDVYIGRFGASGEYTFANQPIGDRGWLGNPYKESVYGREECIALFTEDLLERVDEDPELRRALAEDVAGRDLGCWCRELDDDEPACHGDVIARVADALADNGGSES